MAVTIYSLCALVALACAVLLLRSARRAGSRMLLWCGLCFGCFAITNVLVVADALGAAPAGTEFGTARLVFALVGVTLLLYGLIIEEK